MGIDTRIVPLSRPSRQLGDALKLRPADRGLDPRLIALIRLLARQAADEYYDRVVAPKEAQPPQR